MVSPDVLHETSTIEEVPLADLQIDRSYQRDPSPTLVDDIAANWDTVASELVLVSDRGTRFASDGVKDGLWLVNGQHRSLAARKLGHETIWARVVNLSQELDPAAVEAALRLKLNVKLGDRPLERFKAQVRAGDQDSLEIVKILARFGTEINTKNMKDQGINSVSTVEAIYGADPTGALLAETLELIWDTFHSFGGRNVSASMLKGLAWFIEQHDQEIDRNRAVEKLRMMGMEAVHRRAVTIQSTMGGSSWMNYYRTIVDAYNTDLHTKSRLDWKLKGSGNFAARSKVGAVGAFTSQNMGPGPMQGRPAHPEREPASE